MGDTIELWSILRILWKRLWLIVLGGLLAAVAAYAVSVRVQPVYAATVTLKVDQPANAPLSSGSVDTGENLAATYSRLLRTRPLLETVIARLDLETSPDALRERLRTSLIADTPLLELHVEDSDAQRAADTANQIALTFVSQHDKEHKLESIHVYEQDIVAQMAELKTLIEHNQALLRQVQAPASPPPPAEPPLPTHPVLAAIEDTNEQIIAHMARVKAAARDGDIVVRRSSAPPTRVTDASVATLQNVLSSQQSTYANLWSAYLDIQLTQSQFYGVEIVDPAVPPREPKRPHVPLNTVVGALLGLSMTAGAAFLFEFLDRSLKTPSDVKRALSGPVLGVIPRLSTSDRASALITWANPRSAASESFRTLRTNIRFAGVDRPLSTIVVTSGEAGVGKTTVAVNLGIVCAQSGLRVVLVDADLRLPRLHAALGLGNDTGLTNLLIGSADDLHDAMQSTQVENLSLIASGPLPPNPAELLGSRRMQDVLEIVRRHADLIILDTPPLLPVTDAAVLSAKVDGVLLVARAHKTRRETAKQAAESLAQVGANVLGAALNGVPRPRGAYDGYYYRRKRGTPETPATYSTRPDTHSVPGAH